MAKHENTTMTLGELINVIPDYTSQAWWEVMAIDVPGLDEAYQPTEGDFEEANQIEADYISQHENDVYEVSWPDHVVTRRFNSDATYSLTSLAARMLATCKSTKVLVVANHHHEGFPGFYVIRLYAHSANGPVGIWQLLTDAEIESLEGNVSIYRKTGGGLLLPKEKPEQTVYALARRVWRMLGVETEDIVFL